MGFWKSFRRDLNQAVDELIPDPEDTDETLTENPGEPEEESAPEASAQAAASEPEETSEPAETSVSADIAEPETVSMPADTAPEEPEEPAPEKTAPREESSTGEDTQPQAVVIARMACHGDLEVDGDILIEGLVDGNVTCSGTVTVTGRVTGDIAAKNVVTGQARLGGTVTAGGYAGIGEGTIVLGDITCLSARIGGAVRGNIDVHGPVRVESTAVVVGNVLSQLVEVEKGAIIDGMCEQVYSDVDVDKIFEEEERGTEDGGEEA